MVSVNTFLNDNFCCGNILTCVKGGLRRSLGTISIDNKWDLPGETIWKSSLVTCVILAIIFAVCYHMIFTPDCRPGHNTMPLLWLPVFKLMWRLKVSSYAMTNVYVINYLCGMSKMFEKQKIASLSFCGRTMVFLFRAETAEVVLGSSKFVKKGYEYKVFNRLLNEGLFTSGGEKWHGRRKLLTQTFHFKILQDFLPVLQDKSVNVIAKIETLLEDPWVAVDTLMHSCSLDIILQTAMGVKFDAEDEEIIACIDAVKKGISLCVERMAKPWLLSDFLYRLTPSCRRSEKHNKVIRDFIQKVLMQKKKIMMSSGKREVSNGVSANGISTNGFVKKRKTKAFLDLLLELHIDDKSFTEEDILEEVLTFFIAGFDTTGSALGYTLYLIGLYKDVQEKVHEELDRVFKNSDRGITREDLKRLKYLESTIKEAIRLYPPVPYYSRYATESFKILDSTIPEGSSLIIIPQMVHRDPDIYPDPEKFMPERFFPENSVGRHPFAYLPFSAGPRNCIGQKFGLMEAKTILANILRKFSVTSLDERDKILGINSIGSRCSEPLRMKFFPRPIAQ